MRLVIGLPEFLLGHDVQFKRIPAVQRPDWRNVLDALRADDLTAEQGTALLELSGYRPVAKSDVAIRWTPATAKPLLPELRELARIVRSASFGQPKSKPKRTLVVRKSWNLSQLEPLLVAYLKRQPRREFNIPPDGSMREGELMAAVESAAKAEGRTLPDVLQSIAPVEPLPHLETVLPNEILRRVLNVYAEKLSHIRPRLVFETDGPLVCFEAWSPIGALLLRMREQACKLPPSVWAICANCRAGFSRRRSDKKCCSIQCAEAFKKRRQRARAKRDHNI